jgi:DNA-binding response OmpR family regulator
LSQESRSPQILLVDDDPSILKTLGMRLRASSYGVITAVDGEEALQSAIAFLPDLIILDLNLPKRLGYSVARMLKLDARTKNIPILMLTARSQEADIRLGVLTGANAYVTKPFETRALLETIQRLLAETAARPASDSVK